MKSLNEKEFREASAFMVETCRQEDFNFSQAHHHCRVQTSMKKLPSGQQANLILSVLMALFPKEARRLSPTLMGPVD